MRFAAAALLALAACAPAEPLRHADTMPVEAATDTLRVEVSVATFDAATGVLRLAGYVAVRGPQTSGWTDAVGAQIWLRPPDQTDRSTGSPFIAAVIRKPLVGLSAGRRGAFDFGAVTPDLDGYTLDVQSVGSFGVSLRVDSLVAATDDGR